MTTRRQCVSYQGQGYGVLQGASDRLTISVTANGAGHESSQQMDVHRGDEITVRAGDRIILAGTIVGASNGELVVVPRFVRAEGVPG